MYNLVLLAARPPEWTHEQFLASIHPEDRCEVEAQVTAIASPEVVAFTSTFRTRWFAKSAI